MTKKAKARVARRTSGGVGVRLTGTNISIGLTILAMVLGGGGTWATLGWRITQVENWQNRHEGIDSDMSSVKATLEAMQRQLGSIDNAVNRVGERMERAASPGSVSPGQ